MQALTENLLREIVHWVGAGLVARSASRECGACSPYLACAPVPDCVCGAQGGGRVQAEPALRTLGAFIVGLSIGVTVGCLFALWITRGFTSLKGAADEDDLALVAQAQLSQVRARRHGGPRA